MILLLIVYDSKTGNVQRFINKLNLPSLKISNDLVVEEPFILLTYTTGIGQIPKTTEDFLGNNSGFLMAVACSGNKVWGNNYGAACDQISNLYNVPLLMKFEMSGTETDIDKFKQEVEVFVRANS